MRADVIVHEREVSIRRDEGEDALRFPSLEPHTRVETHVIEETGILSVRGNNGIRVDFKLGQQDIKTTLCSVNSP